INDSTIVKEFSYNYYIPNDKCAWSDDDKYCVLVKWENFVQAPNDYIDKAFDKRSSEISNKTKVRP
ncbi:MAG: molecular chaperone Tir, partial [Flavobacterium sp.]